MATGYGECLEPRANARALTKAHGCDSAANNSLPLGNAC